MDNGRPLPKFGEWDVNDPASAEGFTVIFNKARDEKRTGGQPESPANVENNVKQGVEPSKPQTSPEHKNCSRIEGKNGFVACKPPVQNLDKASWPPVKSFNTKGCLYNCGVVGKE
ncbi:hypothetical protein CK203_011999 [Vitis vinifera]|uniref:RIN4 pathogenic type III effector avirulence factor Avr cleavage site domain-containing protein n=1 Tax=Vitis vinifera TaxID=29760 RepID=A0A438K0E1_VITVI|nr:hypothetical protein CK203_104089 [Vitis vinifera]RVX14670.1 hypothetical protein CK203_011999 [Vitis vinifera]